MKVIKLSPYERILVGDVGTMKVGDIAVFVYGGEWVIGIPASEADVSVQRSIPYYPLIMYLKQIK